MSGEVALSPGERLQAMVREQQSEIAKRERVLEQYEKDQVALRQSLPKLQAFAEDRKKWADELVRIEVAAPKLLEQVRPEGQAILDALQLSSADMYRALVSLSRASIHAKLMNDCLEQFGHRLRVDDSFLTKAAELIRRRVTWTLDEIQASMGTQRRTYHTECHAVEVLLDTLAQWPITESQPVPCSADPAQVELYERHCAAAILTPLVAAYHDIVQDAGPYDNERLSAERLCQDFAGDFQSLLCPRADSSAHAGPEEEGCAMSIEEYKRFVQGMRLVFFASIVSGTHLVRSGTALKVAEHQLSGVLAHHLAWDRVYAQSAQDLFVSKDRAVVQYEVQRLGYLLMHFDGCRFSSESACTEAAKDVRRWFRNVLPDTSACAPADPPLFLRLLDFSYRSGFHVAAGESLRLANEQCVQFSCNIPGLSFYDAFRKARDIFEDLCCGEAGAQALLDLSRSEFTLALRSATVADPGLAYSGALYNVLLNHLHRHLPSLVSRDEREAERCLQQQFPSHTGQAVEGVMDGAGQVLLELYSDFYDLAGIVEEQGEDVILLKDSPTLPAHRLEEKEWCGVVLLYMATQQGGRRMGGTAVSEQIRALEGAIRVTNLGWLSAER
eukprot:RCo039239